MSTTTRQEPVFISEENGILDTDSYKPSQYLQLPKNAQYVSAYIEPRSEGVDLAIFGQRAAVSGAGQRHLDQPRDQVLILHDQYVVHPRFLPVWGYCNPVLLQGCVLTAIILHFFILFSTRIVV